MGCACCGSVAVAGALTNDPPSSSLTIGGVRDEANGCAERALGIRRSLARLIVGGLPQLLPLIGRRKGAGEALSARWRRALTGAFGRDGEEMER